MNKTIIINISGIIFHIEEDAYETLKSYISEVKLHFSNSPDSFEIITDIENRIAELFTEKLAAENKQVIVLADVQEVINKMGKVSDFETTESVIDENAAYGYAAGERVKRRLFRDSDNKIIGGVASGVANYLEVDPTWVRIIWAIFICFWGFGLFIYLILWLVLPEAKTMADKMAMKGEAANLANIKKAVSDKATEIQNNSYIKNFFTRFFEVLGELIKVLAKAFVIFLGLVLIIASIATLFSIATGSAFFMGMASDNFPHNLQLVDPAFRTGTYLSLFFIILIPALFVLWLGIKIIFNKSFLNKTSGLSLLAIWIAALIMGGVYAAKIAGSFKEEASLRQVIDVTPTSSNTFYLNADNRKVLNRADSLRYNITIKNGFSVNKYNGDFELDVDLRIEKSADNKPHLVKIYKARGLDFDSAVKNAQGIIYSFYQKDSVITFNRNVELQKGSLWRNQEVEMVLQLPINTKVVVDQDVNHILRDPYYYECDDSHDSGKQTWIMTADGLKCQNGELVSGNRHHDQNESFDNMLKDIAREAVIQKLSTTSSNITINSDNQNVDFMYENRYNVRTRVKKNNDDNEEVYDVIVSKKQGKTTSDRDSWQVVSIIRAE